MAMTGRGALPSVAVADENGGHKEAPDRPRGKQPRAPLSLVTGNVGGGQQRREKPTSSASWQSEKENGQQKGATFSVYCDDVEAVPSRLPTVPSSEVVEQRSDGDTLRSLLAVPRRPLATISADLPPSLPLDDIRCGGQALFNLSTDSVKSSSPMSLEEAPRDDDDAASCYASVDSDPSDYFTAPPLSDKEQHDDTVYCAPQYVADIYEYLRRREEAMQPKYGYLAKQTDLNAEMRRILVDWLVDVTVEYELVQESLYLAVGYVDRTLSLVQCPRTRLQLYGTTAMLIATKYEEIYPPELKEFVYITDDTYEQIEVVRTERLMLQLLSFDIAAPTAHTFLRRFLKICRAGQRTDNLANYLCDLALLDYDFVQFLPSRVAAAAACLANLMTGPVPWSFEMERETDMTVVDFYPCLNKLLVAYRSAAESPQKSVFEKYSEQRYGAVALLDAPESLPELA